MKPQILSILLLKISLDMALIQESEADQGTLWRSVLISQTRLENGARQSGSQVYSPSIASASFIKLICSATCQNLDWCNLWRYSLDTASCFFYYMYVVAEYKELDTANALLCYTNSMKDYAAGSTITGSKPLLPRYKEHLVDGIHSYGNFADCAITGHYWDDWYLIDLGSMHPIREIKFLTENYPTTVNLKDYEFRIGDHPVPGGDFSSYTQFAFYSEPLGPDKFIVLTQDPPIIGRYVSIQRWSDRSTCDPAGGTLDAKCNLNICHLEIY